MGRISSPPRSLGWIFQGSQRPDSNPKSTGPQTTNWVERQVEKETIKKSNIWMEKTPPRKEKGNSKKTVAAPSTFRFESFKKNIQKIPKRDSTPGGDFCWKWSTSRGVGSVFLGRLSENTLPYLRNTAIRFKGPMSSRIQICQYFEIAVVIDFGMYKTL